ncbi:MAG TPA: hypothetical protein VIW29_22040, partial [Polyangiaceae bacterium]
ILRARMKTSTCLILVALLGACGRAQEAEAPKAGAEPGSPATAAPTSLQAQEESEPATLAEAEQLLEKARADLDRVALAEFAPAPAGASEGAAAAPPPSPAPAQAPPRDPSRAETKSAAADEAEAPAKEASGCETACKAFSSLERASDAVCRLDSSGGQRCARARQIREDAARRVASCACAK